MSEITSQQALENIYVSLQEDNRDLDEHIAALRQAMVKEGLKSVTIEPSKLAQNNRQGRKRLQSYFRQKGVKVDFAA